MKKVTFIVEMDEQLKIAFESWCNDYGIDMSTAINVFARAAVEEQKNLSEISTFELFDLITQIEC